MQRVCHSERSAAKSKNLRIYSYICSEIGAKILRLPSVAQDDTVISTVMLMKADNLNSNFTKECDYMKTSTKAIIIGIISFVVFLIGNITLGSVVGAIIPGGDDYMNSYFHPLYTAVTILISLVISSTYLIVKKINLLLEKMGDK